MRPITVSLGPNASGGARSALVRCDEYSFAPIGVQVSVSGTVNYTVTTSMDDPNSPTNPVAEGSMTWVDSTDTALVGKTAKATGILNFVPMFVSIIMNSGTGTVTMTVSQGANAPL